MKLYLLQHMFLFTPTIELKMIYNYELKWIESGLFIFSIYPFKLVNTPFKKLIIYNLKFPPRCWQYDPDDRPRFQEIHAAVDLLYSR